MLITTYINKLERLESELFLKGDRVGAERINDTINVWIGVQAINPVKMNIKSLNYKFIK